MSAVNGQLHWLVYVTAAAATTGAFALIVAGDMLRDPGLAHWGILCGMVACVTVCAIICDVAVRRISECIVVEAARTSRLVVGHIDKRAQEVREHCNDETREIAEEASEAILLLVNGPRNGTTPIRRR